MLALIAVQEAVASGLGAGLGPAIGAGTLDGFAIGMLLSGALFLVLMAQRHGTRRTRRAIGARRRLGAGLGAGRLRGREGYQSKHRLVEPAEGWTWPAGSRGAPRHAAPSWALPSSLSSALGGRLAAVVAARTLSSVD